MAQFPHHLQPSAHVFLLTHYLLIVCLFPLELKFLESRDFVLLVRIPKTVNVPGITWWKSV